MLDIVCAGQADLDRGRKLADFSSAFICVSPSLLLFKLRDVGVGGTVLNVIVDFLNGIIQRVMADGVHSENVRVVSSVSRSSVQGPCCFCCTRVIFR